MVYKKTYSVNVSLDSAPVYAENLWMKNAVVLIWRHVPHKKQTNTIYYHPCFADNHISCCVWRAQTLKQRKRESEEKARTFTYVWYWAWRKLNSSLILSQVSATVNFSWPGWGGGPCKKKRSKHLKEIPTIEQRKKKKKSLTALNGIQHTAGGYGMVCLNYTKLFTKLTLFFHAPHAFFLFFKNYETLWYEVF